MLRLEISIIVCRHIKKLDGNEILSNGICVIICRVLIKLHIYFMDNPRTIDKARLVIIPVIKDESINVKACSTIFMNSNNYQI